MIRVVFLDVGGTLISPAPSVGAVYSRVAQRHGVQAPADLLEQRFRETWKKRRQARETIQRRWWQALVEETFSGFTFSDPQGFFDDLYHAFEEKEAWQIFPDVVPALDNLRKRGLRLAIASNWDERLPALLDALGLSHYVEKQFVSFQIGLQKPDIRFFQAALRGMGVDALEAIHVGDDVEEDIAGAESAGMRAYLIDRKSRPLNSRSITNLGELLLRI